MHRTLIIIGLTALVALGILLGSTENAARLFSDKAIDNIATVNTRIKFLTDEPNVADQWPRFSPDGKFVLFTRGNPLDVTPMLYVVPSDGGQARPIDTSELGVMPVAPAWSPLGDRIAVVAMSNQSGRSLWLIDPDGSSPQQLDIDSISDHVSYPCWYPDGEHLAVLDRNVIKRIDLKDGTAEELTNPGQVFAGKPSVSPDGKWIAFAGQRNTGQDYDKFKNTLWLINSDGNPETLRQLLDRGRHPNWSPDGKQLTFDIAKGKSTAVFIINMDGTDLKQVTDYELKAQNPDWSPDGKKIVAAAQPEGSIGESNTNGLVIIELDL